MAYQINIIDHLNGRVSVVVMDTNMERKGGENKSLFVYENYKLNSMPVAFNVGMRMLRQHIVDQRMNMSSSTAPRVANPDSTMAAVMQGPANTNRHELIGEREDDFAPPMTQDDIMNAYQDGMMSADEAVYNLIHYHGVDPKSAEMRVDRAVVRDAP